MLDDVHRRLIPCRVLCLAQTVDSELDMGCVEPDELVIGVVVHTESAQAEAGREAVELAL